MTKTYGPNKTIYSRTTRFLAAAACAITVALSGCAPRSESIIASRPPATLAQLSRLEKRMNELIGKLKDKDSYVQAETATLLGELKIDYAVPALIEALADRNPHVQGCAASALGQIARANPRNDEVVKAVPALIKTLKDGFELVRAKAANALGAIGDPRALPDLRKLSESDPDEYARASASKAIEAITKKQR